MCELLHLVEDGASCFTEVFTSPPATPRLNFGLFQLTEGGDFLGSWVKYLSV